MDQNNETFSNRSIALLMDFENLAIGVENRDPDGHSLLPVTSIIRYLEDTYGKVAYRKAFADWSAPKYRKYASVLMRNGVEMQHVVRFGYNNRSAVEGYMAIQAAEWLAVHPEIETFVLGTGDADCYPLISYLRSRGCDIIVLGPEGAIANILASSATEAVAITDNDFRNVTSEEDDDIPMEEPQNEFYGYSKNSSHGTTYGSSRYARKADYNASLPLDEYLRTTRWYIQDGNVRESILSRLFEFFNSSDEAYLPSVIRNEICQEFDVEDHAWQGTIYSLVCGSGLKEERDPNAYYSRTERQEAPVRLADTIRSLDDFVRCYYASLFYKASQDRPDLTPETMSQLMHPEDADSHLALFQAVYDTLRNGSHR